MSAGNAPPAQDLVHATTVEVNGRGALIRGASGQGKSGLALQLLALGAGLVADDRTKIWRDGAQVMADAPDSIRGRIEARGMGILAAPDTGPVPLAVIVDLDHEENDRLPPWRVDRIHDVDLPVIRKTTAPHFPAAIMAYLRTCRLE